MPVDKNSTVWATAIMGIVAVIVFGLCGALYSTVGGQVRENRDDLKLHERRITTMEECAKAIKDDVREVKEQTKEIRRLLIKLDGGKR
ncbi:MAG: hypothetical protein NWE76_04320 [Candidatus Bathyarchaeota archaeon]|nr:hypothetical protein [Candidatus Bathyarchaeota archaeon]